MSNLSLGSHCSKGESATHLSPLLKGNWKSGCRYFCVNFVKLRAMLLISIGKTNLRFKVRKTDRFLSTSNTGSHCTFEAVVISKKLAIWTRNLMQALDLMDSFSQCYWNTPQKQKHQSDRETVEKDSHTVIVSRLSVIWRRLVGKK